MGTQDETTLNTPPRGPTKARVAVLRRLFTPDAPLPGPEVPISGRVFLGRGANSAVPLESDGRASRTHAEIELDADADSLTIRDTSKNGTFVNGRRVVTARLVDGDVLRIGDSFVLVRRTGEPDEPELGGLTGDAPGMRALRRLVRLVAPTDATVLVSGESGTGKELVARALHETSGRPGPFVPINCGAIPEALAESHLFGHVAGAFTGARGDHPGFFRAASGGVLLLDEIGELSLPLQAKLLRVLEERAVTPVGSTRSVPCDARVIAATHRDLRRDVEAKRFRGDLYARLAEITITTPPLRERREDILGLVRLKLGPDAPPLAPDLVEALLTWPWLYNVRELLKVAKELSIKAVGQTILPLELVAERLRFPWPDPAGPDGPQDDPYATMPPPAPAPSAPADRVVPTRDEIVALLREHKGTIADVARATGRSRKQVYRWLEAHALDAEEFRDAREASGR